MPQEVPPPEGFSAIPYKRHLPSHGPPGWALFAGLFACMAVGCELEREKRQLRLQILPIIQAEYDLEYVQKVQEMRRLEAIATADDPNWKVGESVYNRPGETPRMLIDGTGTIHVYE